MSYALAAFSHYRITAAPVYEGICAAEQEYLMKWAEAPTHTIVIAGHDGHPRRLVVRFQGILYTDDTHAIVYCRMVRNPMPLLHLKIAKDGTSGGVHSCTDSSGAVDIVPYFEPEEMS